MRPGARKTQEVTCQADWFCPCHGTVVKAATRMTTDESTGQRKFGGHYFRCTGNYKECGYYVDGNRKTRPTLASVMENVEAYRVRLYACA